MSRRIEQPIRAGVIVNNGIITKFFMDDVSSQRTCVAIDEYNFIKTFELKNIDEVMNFLATMSEQFNAEEIEI